MDIQNKKQPARKNPRLWLPVLITMLAIIIIWVSWLYPQSAPADGEKQSSFTAFKNKINSSLRLLRNDDDKVAPESRGLPPDMDDLRARVFGDQIAK